MHKYVLMCIYIDAHLYKYIESYVQTYVYISSVHEITLQDILQVLPWTDLKEVLERRVEFIFSLLFLPATHKEYLGSDNGSIPILIVYLFSCIEVILLLIFRGQELTWIDFLLDCFLGRSSRGNLGRKSHLEWQKVGEWVTGGVSDNIFRTSLHDQLIVKQNRHDCRCL